MKIAWLSGCTSSGRFHVGPNYARWIHRVTPFPIEMTVEKRDRTEKRSQGMPIILIPEWASSGSTRAMRDLLTVHRLAAFLPRN